MMNLIKFDPFQRTHDLGGLIDDFINGSISDMVGSDFVMNDPLTNIKTSEEAVEIELAVPGFDKSDFHIALDDRTVVITGEKTSDNTDSERNYTRREFDFTKVHRRFDLDPSLDEQSITARYANGVLYVSIRRIREEDEVSLNRVIEVN